MFYSAPSSPEKHYSPKMTKILYRMSQTERAATSQGCRKIIQDREIHQAHSLTVSRAIQFNKRPKFNNKCKQGELIDPTNRANPYKYIPGYKNNNFIMPDRVFEKGKAAKRFFVKMKDTSVFSFRDEEDQRCKTAIKKTERDRTIASRQLEEYNRIIDENDGRKKAAYNTWYLKNRKKFRPAHKSDLFSQCEPLFEPRDPQIKLMKKISLARTFNNNSSWRPTTRGSEPFSSSISSSFNITAPASVA